MITIADFENKFIPEPMSGCFLWEGAQHRQGYGSMMVDMKPMLAHRVSYQIYCGEIPKGMNVLHRCDNPCCVNPDHLFLGTQRDNIIDCYKKGRSSQLGSLNGNSKLTEEDVLFIRASKRVRGSRQKLAKKFGVKVATIDQIRGGRRWVNV